MCLCPLLKAIHEFMNVRPLEEFWERILVLRPLSFAQSSRLECLDISLCFQKAKIGGWEDFVNHETALETLCVGITCAQKSTRHR